MSASVASTISSSHVERPRYQLLPLLPDVDSTAMLNGVRIDTMDSLTHRATSTSGT